MKPTARPQPDVLDRHGRVVIVVEDDTGLREALERLLRASGFDARAFASAEDALRVLDHETVDYMVVDLNLPAMSGLDLIDRLRLRRVTTPVIVISAQDEPHVRAAVQRRSATQFLAKPFLGSALVRALDMAQPN